MILKSTVYCSPYKSYHAFKENYQLITTLFFCLIHYCIKQCLLGYYSPFPYKNAPQTQLLIIFASSKLFKLTELCYTWVPTIAHEPLWFYSLSHLSRSLSKINVNARSF